MLHARETTLTFFFIINFWTFFFKNLSFKIAMTGQVGRHQVGRQASGVIPGLPFG